jgi:hypothetical protein
MLTDVGFGFDDDTAGCTCGCGALQHLAEQVAGDVFCIAPVESGGENGSERGGDRTWHTLSGRLSRAGRAAARFDGIVVAPRSQSGPEVTMIRKLRSGKYRLYSRHPNPRTGKRRNLGTFNTRAAAEKHERAVQYFKRH